MCAAKSILSIQSHVAYGYVGNKAAVYPLQCMGIDVWPVNTVQFSNHTGYKKWQGEIFAVEHIKSVVQGILDIGQGDRCQAILSGYMGSHTICEAVTTIVNQFKFKNKDLIYLCDPVVGGDNCFIESAVLEFFKKNLVADIITPNQYEAEVLSDMKITDITSLKKVADYFHNRGIGVVVVTGLDLSDMRDSLCIFVSDGTASYLLSTPKRKFSVPISGTGDLLSSLYLGYYLSTRDIGLALQYTVYYLQQVLENTYEIKESELQVLSVRYDMAGVDALPPLTVI